jgi:peptide/nickel transport system permease protein
MGLRGYLVKRIIYTIFLIFFVLSLNFVIFEIMPHNPLELFEGKLITPAHIAAIMRQWGLDQPWPVRYAKYVVNMLTFQFGDNNPDVLPHSVTALIMQYLPNTLMIMGLSTLFSILLGVVVGVLAAYKRGGLFDSGSVITSLVTFSLPTFWMAMLGIAIFNSWLGILPSGRIMDDNLPAWGAYFAMGTQFALPSTAEILSRISHMILPVGILTIFQYGNYVLLTRATMIEALTEDYILTAKAKGLKERTIIFKHALKNASLPIITSSALAFGFLIGGAMITETVFSYPGIGYLTIRSIQTTLNMPVLHAIFYVTALTVIFANFISDLLYGVIDPRIKYG